MKTLALIFSIAMLTACSERPPVASATSSVEGGSRVGGVDADKRENAGDGAPAATGEEAKSEADYLGRWTGVEGMYLVVAAIPDGGVTLEMQWDLDHSGSFNGVVTAEGLQFMRNGIEEHAVHSNGISTGLKYLTGKQDCLMVKSGEGYCRD